jgi:hypothetical protein
VLVTRPGAEFALRQVIVDCSDEGLVVGFATAQAKETNLVFIQIYLAANQVMLPERLN